MASYNFEESLVERIRDETLTENKSFVKKTIRLQGLDCQNKMMYAANSIVTSNEIQIKHCTSDGHTGSAALFSDSDIKYMTINFASNYNYTSLCSSHVGSQFSDGYCTGALIDNVKLEPIEQIKMELLDKDNVVMKDLSGNELVSYQHNGFYIDPALIDTIKIAKLRLTLQSYGSFKPVVKKVLVTDGVDVEVNLSSTQPLISRTKSSFVTASFNYAPYPEYDLLGDFVSTTLRTKCDNVSLTDPSTRDTESNCLQTMTEHNMDMIVPLLAMSITPVRWDSTLNDYIIGWKDSETVGKEIGFSTQKVYAGHLKRMQEMFDAGFRLSHVAGATSHMTAFSSSTIFIGDSATYEMACPFSSTAGLSASTAYSSQATPAQQECCFDVDASTGAVSYKTWGNFTCPLGVLKDFNTSTARSGVDQAQHLVELYSHYYYDLYDGNHSLKVQESITAEPTIVEFPRTDNFIIAGEVNDNNIGISSCKEATYWKFSSTDDDYYICRSKKQKASACPAGANCIAVTEFWDDLAGNLKSYDDGRRNITIEVPQTNKRYSNPSDLIDVLWYEEILEDLTPANFDGLASSTVIAGFWHPEDIYRQYNAVNEVAKDKWGLSSNISLDFNDVRASNSWSFDPGCEDFLNESSTCDLSESTYFNSATGACDSLSINDHYYAGSDCNVWSTSNAAACRSTSGYQHYGRGWGKLAGQKILTRLTLVGLSLPSNKLVYQGNVFSNTRGNISLAHPAGNVCWQTERDSNAAIFYRSEDSTGDIYGATSLAVDADYSAGHYGDNLSSISQQLLHGLLGKSTPFLSSTAVKESKWQMDGENYYSAVFQVPGNTGSYYMALWWVPEYIYGFHPKSLYDIDGHYDNMFQLLSPYIEDGYTEKRLTKIKPAFTTAGSAQLIPLDGSATSSLTVTDNSFSLPLGELPVLVKISASGLTASAPTDSLDSAAADAAADNNSDDNDDDTNDTENDSAAAEENPVRLRATGGCSLSIKWTLRGTE